MVSMLYHSSDLLSVKVTMAQRVSSTCTCQSKPASLAFLLMLGASAAPEPAIFATPTPSGLDH